MVIPARSDAPSPRDPQSGPDLVPAPGIPALEPARRPEGAEHIPPLQRFIRQGLGCVCPESVLRDIHVEPAPPSLASVPVDWLVAVGGRLLVLICPPDLPSSDPATLARLAEAAVRLRHEGGFNRVRIVLPVRALPAPDPPELPLLVERLHWHQVPVEDLPPLPATAAASTSSLAPQQPGATISR